VEHGGPTGRVEEAEGKEVGEDGGVGGEILREGGREGRREGGRVSRAMGRVEEAEGEEIGEDGGVGEEILREGDENELSDLDTRKGRKGRKEGRSRQNDECIPARSPTPPLLSPPLKASIAAAPHYPIPPASAADSTAPDAP